jgi:putative Mg2+ transporter-C (MgtC) family protein
MNRRPSLQPVAVFSKTNLMNLGGIEIVNLISSLVQIAIAYVLALPVAWDREKAARSAGLRTFPLVAMASCGYLLLAVRIFGTSNESLARVIPGLITGIGFIGGGAILKNRDGVEGTATAASIWNTGAIGAAVALNRYEIALVLSILNFITLRFLTPIKRSLSDEQD